MIFLPYKEGKSPSAPLLPFNSHQQPYLQRCTFNNTFECPIVNTYPNNVSTYYHLIITTIKKRQRLLTLTFIGIRHKNTILGATSAYSSYVTPLYYIVKWYLCSIPPQIWCPKVANSIAHDYGFIETNLGKHNLTKLANNKAAKKLKHP